MSGLSVASSSGRKLSATAPIARTPKAATTRIVAAVVVKIDPKRICWTAPVVALAVESR